VHRQSEVGRNTSGRAIGRAGGGCNGLRSIAVRPHSRPPPRAVLAWTELFTTTQVLGGTRRAARLRAGGDAAACLDAARAAAPARSHRCLDRVVQRRAVGGGTRRAAHRELAADSDKPPGSPQASSRRPLCPGFAGCLAASASSGRNPSGAARRRAGGNARRSLPARSRPMPPPPASPALLAPEKVHSDPPDQGVSSVGLRVGDLAVIPRLLRSAAKAPPPPGRPRRLTF